MQVGKDGIADVVVYGPGIVDNHAEMRTTKDGRTVVLVRRGGEVLHNGVPLVDSVELMDGDRSILSPLLNAKWRLLVTS